MRKSISFDLLVHDDGKINKKDRKIKKRSAAAGMSSAKSNQR
jgi:hypothetical protein